MAGIYVHIPFCHAKCAYCDFFSTPRLDLTEKVIDGILLEYERRRSELGDSPVNTIYFGGGTPSCLDSCMLERLCRALPMAEACERTIEVNPEDVDSARAGLWRTLGFNRVSMGVQSLLDSELAAVGRRHTADAALKAIKTLRGAGFDNISCDLIYGLPGQTPDTWLYSLDTLLATGIEHLSAYSLGYEPGTRLTAMLMVGKIKPVDDDIVADMYATLCRLAAEAGMEHYEISNFARPGCRSRHNSSYWDGTPYLGLGPGAHSLAADGIRRAAPHDIKAWLAAGASIEEETVVDRINDIIITALRTADGLDTAVLPADARTCVVQAARPYIIKGWLVQHGSWLHIPECHWLVSDAIMRDLLL